MANSKKKLINKSDFSEARQDYADEQHLRAIPFSGKWKDSQYLAYLKTENLIQESRKLGMQTASDVVSEAKIWIYPDWLLQGELTILVGSPDTGKTTFACALAAGVTRGNSHSLAPGLTPTGWGHVIIINREDNIATSLKSRLEAAGADLTKVHFIGCKAGSDNDSTFSFSRERDLARLVGQAKLLGDCLGLIIIDPVYFAVDGDSNNNFKAREAYEQLAQLAKRLTCAILGIAHTVRNTRNKNPLARVAGPSALREVPRAVMLLSKINNGPTATCGTHVLVHAKNNEGKSDAGFEYRIKTVEIPGQSGSNETPLFDVTAPLFGSADDILNKADGGVPSKSIKKSVAAVDFLQEALKNGPQLRVEIQKLAEESGVREGTLMNAKTFLKIVTKKRKGDGRSVWRLPEQVCGQSEEVIKEDIEPCDF